MGKVVKLDYDAAKPTQYRKHMPRQGSGDSAVYRARTGLRDWARYLDENDGTAIGILDAVVNNVVGTGIKVEPMPLKRNGELHERTHRDLVELWDEFRENPEVTGQLPGGELDRLMCRSWVRDGEVFAIDRYGTNKVNRFGYSLRLLEADFLPFEANSDKSPLIRQGVEMDADGYVEAYHFLTSHPGDGYMYADLISDMTRVASKYVSHLKLSKRLSQVRGASILHGVIGRLEDCKNTEDYERVAMQVGAAFTAMIIKNPDMANDMPEDLVNACGLRNMEMAPGVIFDDLLPGEDIKGIGLDRPNTNLIAFIDAQMRAVAAGTGVSFSTIARKYEGNYSSQRQELVETRPNFLRLTEYFVNQFTRRTYRNFVNFIVQTGQYRPRGIDLNTLNRAIYHGPGMIWIDPYKEAQADSERINNKTMSRQQIIRERGGNPEAVDREIQADMFMQQTDQPVEETPDAEN